MGTSRSTRALASQADVRGRIRTLIVERGLGPGDLLPTEPELMATLGVSRNSLREAIKGLQAVGIVDVRHGYGTYVGAGDLQSLEDGLSFRLAVSLDRDLRDVRELLQVRRALEVGLAREVTAYWSTHPMDPLSDVVAEMEAAAASGQYFPDEDWRFHAALYAPLDNRLILELLRVFWRTFHEIDPRLPGPRYTPSDAAGWHRRICDALAAGDPDAAAVAMADHFSGISVRLATADGAEPAG
ncbi:GntR domain protein [Beutenbergia cavernae DSM 12333]|uniref:GntR domain protein n=1 Tax=Beutenbergia cavernae (strain ATCC BAA-8 / DSM 12333 / CCUG 43141 / JCM 11478 / NBRC 16432 / NCIMB 13614 / HKI 0122) TaxID=471853 RepID=C5C2K6_BEUC1|nr:FadR/GntR family transcriptional regulator [Beutenbergia cavernae]ACQ79692.1 GntR domain protein [Beutenbergia cavernae DSM 12333]